MSKSRGLSKQAYEPVPEGQSYSPYIPASESPLEFTVKSVVAGALLGVVFGVANAYIGLLAGLTISTSIPVAVMTVAVFRAVRPLGVRSTLLEANQAQTIGSSSSSIASGVIFTLPALFMWGFPPSLLQMTLLAMCGGLLGVLFMIPLRRFLIDREHGHLPYPEGTACAEVLVASEVGGAKAKNIFLAIIVGAVIKFLTTWLKVIAGKLEWILPGKASIGLKVSPALFGVGFILGPRIGAIMVGGGLLSSLIIIPIIAAWGHDWTEPFYPETELLVRNMSPSDLWNRYIRYIGAGAVAAAGLITLARSIPVMIASFKIGAAQLRARVGGDTTEEPRTSRDLSLKFVAIAVLIVTGVLAFIPDVFGIEDRLMRWAAAGCVVIFAFFFVTVASRIVGLVGVTSNPTSGMTIATLLGTATVFWLMGWRDDIGRVTALTVGCVVCIAASISGDTSQDLKTGFLLGATPWRQQIGELIGVLTCATAVAATLQLMHTSIGFGGDDLPAPQATLMKLVIDGVLNSELPWGLVAIGAGIAIIAELIRIPSLPLAVGVYLPVSTMVPVFLGGLLRWFVERRASTSEDRDARRERGVLFGSGLVGGEGLMGVALVGATAYQLKFNNTKDLPWVASAPTVAAALIFIAFVVYFLQRCTTEESNEDAKP
jgi:putative OPT family oligopeptide transporter